MKMLKSGLVLSLGIFAGDAMAELTLNVDGENVPVTTLMENCKTSSTDPAAQIACFNKISELLGQQSGGSQEAALSVPEALDAWRAVAQFEGSETGLSITGSDCNVQIVYYNNYFHISRRNVSTLDVFSAAFDASNLDFDQVADAQAPLVKGLMVNGATAVTHGGVAMESTQHNFAPKSARTSIADYAIEVVAQLPARENADFEFVLVHPQNSQASADIRSAFGAFVKACNAS